jgi:hypothetical protein
VKKLIGLALELPPLPLGFVQQLDKRPSTCRQMNENDLSSELCCSRQKWLLKSKQVKTDAIVTSPTALSAKG